MILCANYVVIHPQRFLPNIIDLDTPIISPVHVHDIPIGIFHKFSGIGIMYYIQLYCTHYNKIIMTKLYLCLKQLCRSREL